MRRQSEPSSFARGRPEEVDDSPAYSRRHSAVGTALLAGMHRPPAACPSRRRSAPAPTCLGAGDELRIVVYDQPSLTNLYEVDQSGQISLPLIGDVPASDSTADELAERIEAKLATAYLREPNVTVEVATYRPFFVLGEVGTPGQYPYVPGHHRGDSGRGRRRLHRSRQQARRARQPHRQRQALRVAHPGDRADPSRRHDLCAREPLLTFR